MKVAVSMATCFRPQGLERALTGLGAMNVEQHDVHLIVVDNDPGGSARAAVDRFATTSRMEVHYVVESRPGIPQARNRGLALARSIGADAIAILDDDEEPDVDWICQLVDTMLRFNADVVYGPVLPRFLEPPPRWILEGRFFERPRRPTGTVLRRAYTHNVLVRARVFETVSGFDESWGLQGGDDDHFFQMVYRAGFKMVACDEAIVHEDNPPSRVSARWLIARSFRQGNTDGICRLKLARSSALTRLWVLLLGGGETVKGILEIFFRGVILPGAFWGIRNATGGIGRAVAALGYRFDGYQR